MSSRVSEILRRTARLYALAEQWTIVVMMVVLILFALYQILLRNFFSTGVVWGDNLLRHLVLWIGFLGACRATAEGRHIQIDLPALIPDGRLKSLLGLLRILFLTTVCAAMFHASLTFLSTEMAAGDMGFLRIPYWWLETIFPLSFLVMTIRSLNQLQQSLRTWGHAVHP